MEARPDLYRSLLANRPGGSAVANGRRVIMLASHAPYATPGANTAEWLKAAPPTLPGILAALRARVNGRPVARDFDATEVDRCAEMMKAAKFGVAIWSPDEIDALAIEMLVGLIRDLNAKTRWSGLSVSSDPTLAGAAMASGWMTGLPLRCGFGRGRAEHDPWRYEARRLVESGEADALVWISAFGQPPPQWAGAVATIVVRERSLPENGSAAVALPVGRPGRDHDGVLYDGRTGTLAEVAAERPSNAFSVAAVLTRIAARLDAR
jgi:formylmethanofuran dehydrogenase subunit B